MMKEAIAKKLAEFDGVKYWSDLNEDYRKTYATRAAEIELIVLSKGVPGHCFDLGVEAGALVVDLQIRKFEKVYERWRKEAEEMDDELVMPSPEFAPSSVLREIVAKIRACKMGGKT